MKFASGPFLCRWGYRGQAPFPHLHVRAIAFKNVKAGRRFFAFHLGGGVPIVPPRGTRPFDGRFWQRWRRPGPACGLRRRFCAALRCRPARRDDAVGGLSGLGRAAGHAPDDRRRSSSAACLWLQRARQAAGIGRWQALAGGGYWRVAGIGEALGWASLSKGQAVERRSCDAVARAGAPAQGQGHRRVARFVRRA